MRTFPSSLGYCQRQFYIRLYGVTPTSLYVDTWTESEHPCPQVPVVQRYMDCGLLGGYKRSRGIYCPHFGLEDGGSLSFRNVYIHHKDYCTSCCIQEDHNMDTHCLENLKPYTQGIKCFKTLPVPMGLPYAEFSKVWFTPRFIVQDVFLLWVILLGLVAALCSV
jgi:hypothetical protein